ncbi:4-alpha-glucanotransferase [Defluviimonas aestuarii]|uniref:4-alpha-glucanotransferase n=1 Tax=Albidovulum aestuarii TaxID=1130726 RepID=UPI00249A9ED6|nr:4-alpha-glucanotransferase [Defluviimonas aestuarii]MDI3336873.1 4-alpha-glucanotransferase [Defluviimonas aestuarii]
MKEDEALERLADRMGILPSFHDLGGTKRCISPETQKALLQANGLDVGSEALIREALAEETARDEERTCPAQVILNSRARSALDFGAGAQWRLHDDGSDGVLAEGGGEESISLPPLPSGVYDLVVQFADRTETVLVLVAPPRLPQVEEVTRRARLWGLNAALYGLQSHRNAGLGDYEDLARIGEIAASQGAGFIGINPVHAMGAEEDEAISPYSPSHRGFLNTTNIALDRIPGLGASVTAREVLERTRLSAARLRGSALVQYADHRALHRPALEALYEVYCREADTNSRADFSSWVNAAGPDLSAFAAYEAATEQHGPDWRAWSGEVKKLERAEPAPRRARMEYHSWLQWVADRQLTAAQERVRSRGMALGLYVDLAVGSRRGGAETWCEADVVAEGVSIGAPPDHLSPGGQNWNLAAFAPRKLQARKYAPFRRILQQSMRKAGILRIDHVLGLMRSYWVPDDGSPGGYVRQPFEALIALIKIEAERASAVVVGEDLGLVPEGFRAHMRQNGFYGYSVLQYEKDQSGHFRDPSDYGSQVLACFGTHDTPTLAGFAKGRDIDWWRGLGWIGDVDEVKVRARRAADVAVLGNLAKKNNRSSDPVFQSVHTALARSPAELVAVQLDDVVGETEAQNLPGTIDEHPNWRRKCKVPLDAFSASAELQTVAQWMRDSERVAKPADQKEA